MFAIVRPGPYICSEWEFGGLPSWLLRDKDMKVRSNYSPFLNATENYLKKITEVIKSHQFSTNGGPIIAVQIENDFASFGNTKAHNSDQQYLTFLKNTLTKYGIKELFFTSDNNLILFQKNGNIPGVLIALNSANPKELETLNKIQPNSAQYIAEFWTGSAYRYGDKYHARDNNSENSYRNSYETALIHYNASVSIYMFSGGTNFGFMNGANLIYTKPLRYHSYVASYSHDAPLSEAGDYTQSYWSTKNVIEKLAKERNFPKLKIPEPPKENLKASYGTIKVLEYLTLNELLKLIKPIASDLPKHMEMIDIKPNYGQNFGFTVYRTEVQKFSKITFEEVINDRAIIAIDDNNTAIVEDINTKNLTIKMSNENFEMSLTNHTLDIIVENMGRLNFGANDELNRQRKGLNGSVFIDDKSHHNWNIYPLEFVDSFVHNLKNVLWKKEVYYKTHYSPTLFRAELVIKDVPKDTFVKLNDKWIKGVIFVNGFNIARFWNIGPQKSYFIPSTLLKSGINDIYIFDLHKSLDNFLDSTLEFIDKQFWI
jgi:hypothetical protein